MTEIHVLAAQPPISALPRWEPEPGGEIRRLLDRAPAGSRERVETSAISILSKCAPPGGGPRQETGLVIGYVQSGKTLSFNTVTALARDNGFQIVILVAGTSVPLYNQSRDRLIRDLGLNDRRDRKWQLFGNPLNDETTRAAIRGVLADWQDATVSQDDKQTVLITVMKHHQRLANLIALLRELDLADVPALVIDDEADQASLNAGVNVGEQSRTYSRLLELKACLPLHTLLQYTATPQAPLLINIIDALSPGFVEVLEPGPEYVGGRDFFVDLLATHVRPIPPGDVPSADEVPPEDPPESLLAALRAFMVGIAAQLSTAGNVGNRSMLVHPSHRTASHETFFRWVNAAVERWKRTLESDLEDPDREDLIDEFRVAHRDLARTEPNLPDFDQVAAQLVRAFRRTQVLEVNARGGRTPPVDWQNTMGWILVGGQAMDRGFTVEGLTVTYMPRPIGVGNADTVQQRGRFFGYKRPYVGYCRIYLDPDVSRAFHDYVEHEEDIRAQLQNYQESGEPLSRWKRAFVMSQDLRPCRDSVLDLDYMRGRLADEWFDPKYVLAPAEIITGNREVADQFVGRLAFVPDDGNEQRTPTQRHEVCRGVPLDRVLSDLLVPVRLAAPLDSQRYTGLLLQLRRALDANPDETCAVYRMSMGATRERSVGPDGRITNLFQGAAPVEPRHLRGSIYPGDRAIRENHAVTVQIHNLDLTAGTDGLIVAERVPVIAVWVPSRLATPWLVQEDGRARN